MKISRMSLRGQSEPFSFFRKVPLLEWAMILGPLWFAGVVFFAGALTPDYVQGFRAISELAAPGMPYAALVRFGGFLPLGLLLVVLTVALGRSPEPGVFRLAGLIIFGLTGLAILVAGIFPTDPFGRRETSAGIIHAAAGIILLMLCCLAPLVMAAVCRARPGFRVFSLVVGVVLTGLFVLIPNGLSPDLIALHKKILGEFFTVWYRYYGLHQRVFLAIYFAWLLVFSRLYLRDGARPDGSLSPAPDPRAGRQSRP